MYIILHGFRDTTVWISRPNPVTFLFVGLDEKRSLQKKVDTLDELLSRILDAAARIKKCQEQLRLTTRDLRSQVEDYTEVELGFPNIYCEL